MLSKLVGIVLLFFKVELSAACGGLDALGMESGSIKDAQITGSSSLGGHTPQYSRLNRPRAWLPASPIGSWLMVDFKEETTVTAITVQTKLGAWEHVKQFKISYSKDNVVFHLFHKLDYGSTVSREI